MTLTVKDLKKHIEAWPDDAELVLDKNSWEDYENNLSYVMKLRKANEHGPAYVIINN